MHSLSYLKNVKRLLFISIFIYNFNIFARTTYEQILDNNKHISKIRAKKIAFFIDKVADKYKVPANILAGIAMTESSYRLDAINSRTNDYGIFQINEYNIKAYKFNKQRLLTDLEYSIEAGAKVFKWFYKTYKTAEEAVKRYNGGTAKNVPNWKGPKLYWKKVQRYM